MTVTRVERYALFDRIAGHFSRQPSGILLHSSRSPASKNTPMQEYQGTANFAVAPADQNTDNLCWNATIGPGIYAVHLKADCWGWNAFGASLNYLAVEFAQQNVDVPITDDMIEAFVAWFNQDVKPFWPRMDLASNVPLPCHSEIAEGRRVGKTDPFPDKDPRNDDLRTRIRAVAAGKTPDVSWQDAIEQEYERLKDRLGEKRFACLINRKWGGQGLICENGGLVYRDGKVFDITSRLIDDALALNTQNNTLVRY